MIVRKKDITGISGHVCDKCLTFQYRYIKDMGFESTASEKHNCDPMALDEVGKLQDKIARLDQIRAQAHSCLAKLINSIWTGKKICIC